ncbi:MAG: hypothetical protein ACYCZN_01640 [Candidatus Dormibacteria bacterium]
MGRIAKIGTALALGGAMAVVASGCGSASPTAQQLAVKTASSYARTQVVGTVGGFRAQRESDGEWKVSFSGKFTESGKGDVGFMAVCRKEPSATIKAPGISKALQVVSANGKHLVGGLVIGQYTGQWVSVTCPAS